MQLDSNIIASIISCIIPTIALVVQFFSFRSELKTVKKTESIKTIFQLTEFYNKPRMLDVYSKFQTNGDYTKKAVTDYTKEELFAIFEYLELFIFAYDICKSDFLDKSLFFKKFSYRISNFQNTPIVNSLIENEPWEWEALKKLIIENEEYAIKNQQKFL